MKNMVTAVLQGYKRWISPMLPHSCRYVPTCSEYAMEAVDLYGVLRGAVMAAWRIVRCNPFGGHGYDPVVKEPCCVQEHPHPSQNRGRVGHPRYS